MLPLPPNEQLSLQATLSAHLLLPSLLIHACVRAVSHVSHIWLYFNAFLRHTSGRTERKHSSFNVFFTFTPGTFTLKVTSETWRPTLPLWFSGSMVSVSAPMSTMVPSWNPSVGWGAHTGLPSSMAYLWLQHDLTTGTEKDRRVAPWIQERPDANPSSQFCMQSEELTLVRGWSYCTFGTITFLILHQTRSVLESRHFLGQPWWRHFHLNSTGHESLKTRLYLMIFNSTWGLSETNCIIQTRPTAAGSAFPYPLSCCSRCRSHKRGFIFSSLKQDWICFEGFPLKHHQPKTKCWKCTVRSPRLQILTPETMLVERSRIMHQQYGNVWSSQPKTRPELK